VIEFLYKLLLVFVIFTSFDSNLNLEPVAELVFEVLR
jgi:hypothetical protein